MPLLNHHGNKFEKDCLNCIIENIKNALEKKPIDIERIETMKYYLKGNHTGIETTDNAIEKLLAITDYGSTEFNEVFQILDMDEQIQFHKLVPKNQRYKKEFHDKVKIIR